MYLLIGVPGIVDPKSIEPKLSSFSKISSYGSPEYSANSAWSQDLNSACG